MINIEILLHGIIGENAVPVSSNILDRFFLWRLNLSNKGASKGPTIENVTK